MIKVPKNSYLIPDNMLAGDTIISTVRAKPYMDRFVLRVSSAGGMTFLSFKNLTVAKEVSTKSIHKFNVASGCIDDDTETVDQRQKESERTSISRTRRIVRELVASNPWEYFATVTLDPKKFNDRNDPEAVKAKIKALAAKWRNMKKGGEKPYKSFAYLFVPELHERGGLHLHGVVKTIPQSTLIEYTTADIQDERPLPKYICETVKSGGELLHCSTFDETFGYNLLERIKDQDRAANYIVKYIGKDIGSAPLKSRVWHSRGLQRARFVCAFQIPAEERQIEKLEAYLMPLIATTADGHKLITEHKDPEGRSAGVTIYVNRECADAKTIVSYLLKKYPLYDLASKEK